MLPGERPGGRGGSPARSRARRGSREGRVGSGTSRHRRVRREQARSTPAPTRSAPGGTFPPYQAICVGFWGRTALLVTAHKWNFGGELLKTRISNGERDECQPPGRRMKIGRGVTTEDRLGSTAVPESLQRVVQCAVGLRMSTPRAPRVLHRHRCLMGAGFLLQRAGTCTADFIFH